MRIIDGEYVEIRDDSLAVSRALTAGGGPLFPPAEWFSDPGFDRPMPISVTADGRIKGHIAAWRTDHIGMPPNTKPPRSRSDYAFFKTGVIQVDNGEEVQVGQLTLAGGHAPMTAGADDAVKHYDDTQSAVADVTVGEDEFGIWVSGGVRPGVTDEQIRALRASAPSGDWRPIDGSLELVAICQVNTPGFPIARAMVASGEVTALVAAGAGYMYGLQQEANIYQELDRQQQAINELEALVASIKSKKKKSDEEESPEVDKETPEEDKPDEWDEDKKPVEEDDEGDERARMRLRAKFKKKARARR